MKLLELPNPWNIEEWQTITFKGHVVILGRE
jgi:hypothetical protein